MNDLVKAVEEIFLMEGFTGSFGIVGLIHSSQDAAVKVAGCFVEALSKVAKFHSDRLLVMVTVVLVVNPSGSDTKSCFIVSNEGGRLSGKSDRGGEIHDIGVSEGSRVLSKSGLTDEGVKEVQAAFQGNGGRDNKGLVLGNERVHFASEGFSAIEGWGQEAHGVCSGWLNQKKRGVNRSVSNKSNECLFLRKI
jgi:hypothetical protein